MFLDLALFSWLNSWGEKFSSETLFLAVYLAHVLVGLFFIFLMRQRGRWRIFLEAIFATLVARGILTPLIRYFYHRPRPFLDHQAFQLFSENSYSFPSGHATFFFALATIVWFYDKSWGTVFYFLTTLMVVARVMAGVHYPSDIVGGAIIGMAVGLGVFHLSRRQLK